MVTIAVDDDLQAARMICEMMKDADPEGVHFAGDDPAAMLERAESSKPDIAWLDIEMQGMNGLEMAAKIMQLSPETNIVFVTAHPEYAIDAFGMHASGYVLKPATEQKILDELNNLRRLVRKVSATKLRVQCFGSFDVFAAGGRMKFARSLSKEAFAYLVDRRGAGCTVGEICSILWEDRQADKMLKSQCRVILGSLKKDLETVGAGDVIVKNWNTWGIDTGKISCDYYDFLKGDALAENSFRGEYMAQYSWAEMTIGGLLEVSGQ